MENNSKYALKKQKMKSGSYHGNSPFFKNIPEFQHLHSLASYPHLTTLKKFRLPSTEAEKQMNRFNTDDMMFE